MNKKLFKYTVVLFAIVVAVININMAYKANEFASFAFLEIEALAKDEKNLDDEQGFCMKGECSDGTSCECDACMKGSTDCTPSCPCC